MSSWRRSAVRVGDSVAGRHLKARSHRAPRRGARRCLKFISPMALARERSRFHFAAVLLAAWPQLASGAAKIAKWSAPGTNYRGPPFHQAIPICDSITYRLRKPHITRRLLTLRPVLSRSPCGLPDADGGSPRSTAAGLRRRAALQAHQCWP